MCETQHQYYMARCLALAERGQGTVAPNPMVGAVLVYQGRIIGEGWHQKFGCAHAEVNCINDALHQTPALISSSTLYISLEPCAHTGKTPPCTDLIIAHKIPKVVIGCRDSAKHVNGIGIEKLKQAGVGVTVGILEKNALALNKRFFTFHQAGRPYVVLKWAQTADGLIAGQNAERLYISNEITNRLVHKWRSREAGILVGARTAVADDPLLNNRGWYGQAPVKILVDPQLKSNNTLRLFTGEGRLIVVNKIKEGEQGNIKFLKIGEDNFVEEMLAELHRQHLLSVLIEGGRHTLQSFIDAGLWDEARVITNTQLSAGTGLASPLLCNAQQTKTSFILHDRVDFFKNHHAGTGLL